MKTVQLVLKVVALMGVIFASGVWVGRQTVTVSTPPEVAMPPSSDTLPPQVRKVVERYVVDLQLDADQQKAVVPLMRVAAPRLAALPKNSPERFAVLEEFHRSMAPQLNDEQKDKARRILDAARARVEQRD
jgi:hypothetical protein